MKKFFTSLFLGLCLLLACNSYAGISNLPAANDAAAANTTEAPKLGIDDLRNLSVKEIEAKIGHDLTWKQKLAIKVLKSKATKAEKHPEKPAHQQHHWLPARSTLEPHWCVDYLCRFPGRKKHH